MEYDDPEYPLLNEVTNNDSNSDNEVIDIYICPSYFGPLDVQCAFCKAYFFQCEYNFERASTNMCCNFGNVQLPYPKKIPQPLEKLLTGNSLDSKQFKVNIVDINSIFCFTSVGLKMKHQTSLGGTLY